MKFGEDVTLRRKLCHPAGEISVNDENTLSHLHVREGIFMELDLM